MAKSKSWSVKGIDGETRDLARTAAQAAGMTIGTWIDQAILKAKHDALPEPAASGSTTSMATIPDSRATPVEPDRSISPAESVSVPPSNIEQVGAAPSQNNDAEPPPVDAPENTQLVPVEISEPGVPAPAIQPIEGSFANAGVAEPMPISRRPARTSAGHYAILGVALVATLAGGGWLFTEFSQWQKTSALERSAGVQTPATDRAAPAAPGQAAPAVSDAIRAEIDLARAGDAKAQYNLATAYAEGKGIARNYPKALEWFTKSANAGVGASQYSLAAIYESGLVNGKPDLAQARAWYEKAAAQGDTKATERLALMGKVPSADRTASTNAAAPVPSTATAILKAVGRQEIREIQSLLVQMNFNPGPADGQMGSKTADAIRLYQQFAGIKIDGVPGQELLDEMRAVASSMSSGG